MPKQQIEADICESTQDYLSQPVPNKNPLRPIQNNILNVSPQDDFRQVVTEIFLEKADDFF